jgi:hypothetical protein
MTGTYLDGHIAQLLTATHSSIYLSECSTYLSKMDSTRFLSDLFHEMQTCKSVSRLSRIEEFVSVVMLLHTRILDQLFQLIGHLNTVDTFKKTTSGSRINHFPCFEFTGILFAICGQIARRHLADIMRCLGDPSYTLSSIRRSTIQSLIDWIVEDGKQITERIDWGSTDHHLHVIGQDIPEDFDGIQSSLNQYDRSDAGVYHLMHDILVEMILYSQSPTSGSHTFPPLQIKIMCLCLQDEDQVTKALEHFEQLVEKGYYPWYHAILNDVLKSVFLRTLPVALWCGH